MVFLIKLFKKVLIPCEISINSNIHGFYFYLFSHSKFWDVTANKVNMMCERYFLGFICVCKKVNMFLYFRNKMMLKIKVRVNVLERCFL
jgi:hypothetical protein